MWSFLTPFNRESGSSRNREPEQQPKGCRRGVDHGAPNSGPKPKGDGKRPSAAKDPEPRGEYEQVRSQHPERKEYQRLHEQKKRERAKELGPCRNCSKPAIPGMLQSPRRSDTNRRAAVNETAATQAYLA